jgi:hypothetical protein
MRYFSIFFFQIFALRAKIWKKWIEQYRGTWDSFY